RQDKGDTPYNLRNCAYLAEFDKEKIVFQEIVQESTFYYDIKKFICADTARIITGNNLKYLISIFNSKLFFYGMKTYYCGGKLGEKGIRMKHTFMQNFPIVELSDKNQKVYIDIVNEISELSETLKINRDRLYRRLTDNFDNIKISKKLELFERLDFKLFVKELNKQKIKLSLIQQDEWEEYFKINRDKCINLKIEISKLDNIMDKMIYKLYKLTYDEVLIIDNDFSFSKIEYDKI
ncbi:MAG: hypothetical protein IMY73_00390, partial [Bacteroidetes bacterium]|nr:hypothetical protein [Bacteroidota bacterium]